MVEPIIKLSEEEADWWSSFIIDKRQELIRSPSDYVDAAALRLNCRPETIASRIEEFIVDGREAAYEAYLEDEAKLNSSVVKGLIELKQQPAEILRKLNEAQLLSNPEKLDPSDADGMVQRMREVIGDFTGAIFPYLYALSSSNTNSRRSRSGLTFEKLIYKAFDLYGYPFEDQSILGKDFFEDNGLGKKVDAIIPGAKAFHIKRSDCAIVSMKTSLRERWQQLVEELTTSGIPHIYLATVDDSITKDTVKKMKQYNITVVLTMSEKMTKFEDEQTLMSFDTFFNREIPYRLMAWENKL